MPLLHCHLMLLRVSSARAKSVWAVRQPCSAWRKWQLHSSCYSRRCGFPSRVDSESSGDAHTNANTYVCIVAICLYRGLVGLAHGKNACLGRGEEIVQICEGLRGGVSESQSPVQKRHTSAPENAILVDCDAREQRCGLDSRQNITNFPRCLTNSTRLICLHFRVASAHSALNPTRSTETYSSSLSVPR